MRPRASTLAAFTVLSGILFPACASGPDDASPSLARQVAATYGAAGWDEVSELSFTFEVRRSNGQVVSRRWTWDRTSDLVTLHRDGSDLTFRYGHPANEAQSRLDAAFVNDSFWLLFPLHLGWDDGITIAEDRATSPFAPTGEPRRRLHVRYARQGGYTPGDAYDLWIDPDGRVEGWGYYKGGGDEASLLTSWDDQRRYGPLLLSLERKSPDGSFALHFRDVSVATKDGPATAPASRPASRPAAQNPAPDNR